MDLDIKYYLSVFWKRLPLFLLVSLSLSAVGVTVAKLLPATYSSQAIILVESPQISPDLAQSTVQVGSAEIIQVIRQRVLRRENLLSIAREHNVFGNDSKLSPSEIVSAMRAATEFKTLNLGNSRRGGATAFSIVFQSNNPRKAAAVANELVTNTLALNTDLRVGTAEKTKSFFDKESERLDEELRQLEENILVFKNENANALPEGLEYNRAEMTRLQGRLTSLDEKELGLQEQVRQLKRVIADPSLLASQSSGQLSPEERKLASMKLELQQKLSVFSESHPQVVAMKNEIAAFEALVLGVEDGDGESAEGSRIGELKLTLEQFENELERIANQRLEINDQLAILEQNILQTPGVEMALNSMYRAYDSKQGQYRNTLQSLATASTGTVIELLGQGERFEVIEQPIAPDRPDSPNRVVIAGLGVVGGIGLGLGLIVLLEILNKKIQRPVELVNKLGIQAFAEIPYIETRREKVVYRAKLSAGLVLVSVGIPVALAVFHYQVLPLDLVFERLLDKAGLSKIF